MNILVTGGAGYIGSSLVEELNKLLEVDIIYVLDNLSRSPLAFFIGCEKLSKVTFVKGDILDSYVLEQLIPKVDVIYHLAGYVSSPYNYSQNVQYEQINQWGTLNLVRCIQQSFHRIDHFIYLSSASVYGLRGVVELQKEPQPSNAYGKSKLAGEKFSMLLKDKCKVSIIRSANVFGFNTSFRMDSVLNNFIFHALVDKKILIYGDGTQKRPFVSLEECIKKLIRILSIENNDSIHYAVQFNADLNELKDWLLDQVAELEYTYINRNINYEGQFLEKVKSLQELSHIVNNSFSEFRSHLRIEKK